VVGIAVPIAVALIGAGAQLLGSGGDAPPGVVYNEVSGSQYQGDVAFTTVTLMAHEAEQTSGEPMPEALQAILRQAMSAVDDGAFDKAIPLLEAAAEAAPSPAVLNNLGAAYLAAGEAERARAALTQAKDAHGAPEETAAVLHNLRQVATAGRGSFEGPTEPSISAGIVAELTRFDDAGGMVTLEVTFTNTATDQVQICVDPRNNYLIDEATGKRWDDQHQSHNGTCPNLQPGERFVTWSKFLFEDHVPPVLTAVASGVARPFEGLRVNQD
jgi:hypothetical protein